MSRDRGPLIAYILHPEFLPFVKELKADYVVYHAYDLFRFMDKNPARFERDENHLLESADLVIATSEETARDFRTRTKRHIEVLGNGVDWSRFVMDPRPPDPPELAHIPRPRIGYVGAINQKVDLDLILDLARRQSSWQFVLVGPVHNVLPSDADVLEAFKTCSNIHLIGAVRSIAPRKFSSIWMSGSYAIEG
jgi:glycosyltransferase involved in cell wall biosynthesis